MKYSFARIYNLIFFVYFIFNKNVTIRSRYVKVASRLVIIIRKRNWLKQVSHVCHFRYKTSYVFHLVVVVVVVVVVQITTLNVTNETKCKNAFQRTTMKNQRRGFHRNSINCSVAGDI